MNNNYYYMSSTPDQSLVSGNNYFLDNFEKEFECDVNNEKSDKEVTLKIYESTDLKKSMTINNGKRILTRKFKPISNFNFLEEHRTISYDEVMVSDKLITIKQSIDNSTISESNPGSPMNGLLEQPDNLEKKCQEILENHTLSRMIFSKDLQGITSLLKEFFGNKELLTKIINQPDLRGNTPIMLCVLLRSIEKAQEYLEILAELFKCEANPKLRNEDKWTPLEVATSLEDSECVCLLFEFLLTRRHKKIIRHKDKASIFLSSIPNLYIEMYWEVNVPLLSIFCPKDTCKIIKYDQNVKMDYTFVQFKNLSSVRRPSSFIFRQNPRSQEKEVFRADHELKTFFNPFEEFEDDERILIIQEILNNHRLNGEFKLKDCAINESKSYWSGKPVYETVDGFKCQKYEINVVAFVNLHNKEKLEYENLNAKSYFNPAEELNKRLIVIMDENKMKDHIANGLRVKNNTIRNQIMKINNNKDKKLKAYVWVAEDYPIKSSHLVALFDSLSSANEFTQKIKEFLNNPEVKKITDKNGFPVKIKIPVNFFVDVTVTFTNLKRIYETPNKATFEIPKSYKQISRKANDNLVNDSKKRLAYANIQG